MLRPPARPQRFLHRCSFCGRRQEKPRRLIAGPGGVYICSECIRLCAEIFHEEVPGYWPVEKAQESTAESWYPDSCIICGEEIQSDDGDDRSGLVDAFFLEAAGRTLHDATHYRCHLTCFRTRAAPAEWVDYEEDDFDAGEGDEDGSDVWEEDGEFDE